MIGFFLIDDEQQSVSTYKDLILSNLHRIMRYDPLLIELANASGIQFDDIESLINDFETQLSIDTATWGLDLYEKDLGIETDISKSFDERRARIKFKRIGTGVINARTIKLAALAYPNGDCEVSFNGGHIVIKFSSVVGVPDFLENLKDDLEEMKPAHLRIEFEFNFLTIAEVESMTIAQLESTPLDQIAWG